MKNNFDKIAFIYDFLANFFLGKAWINSQKYFISSIKKSDNRVLIVGGGTGRILTQLDWLEIPLKIDYIEKSKNMLICSRKRGCFRNIEVNFINNSIEKSTISTYDIIITHFFLDVLAERKLIVVMEKLSNSLINNGKWLVTDFVRTNSFIKRKYIQLMYVFFRITTNLECCHLIDFNKKFADIGLKKKNCKKFYFQMIESCLYQNVRGQ